MPISSRFDIPGVSIFCGDSLDCYPLWDKPTCIVSDGAYGIGGFPGDPKTPEGLADWYRPHIEKWSECSTTSTTLWFWNTEVGWANVHPVLLNNGWKYVRCCIWDKGRSHIAGNCNTATMRQFPCVSEVCVQYVRRDVFNGISIQNWLRSEWLRTGLPLCRANEACGVKAAAVRKYLSSDSQFYFPPDDVFEKLRKYANEFGKEDGKPYFEQNGDNGMERELRQMKFNARPKFHLPFGFTNVWQCPPVSGCERMKIGNRTVHPNQKPLSLVRMIIEASTDKGDVVWEPFGGLFTACLAAAELGRRAFGCEMNQRYFDAALPRLELASI